MSDTSSPCPSCGAALDAAALFCKQCGASVKAATDDKGADEAPRRRPAPRRDRPDPPPRAGFQVGQIVVGALTGALGAALIFYLFDQRDQAPPTLPPTGATPHDHDHGTDGAGEGGPMMGGGALPGGPPVFGGTISLAEEAKASAPAGGVFYVMARPAGQPDGPPLAVVRVPASSAPTPFTIGPQDVMIAGALDAPVLLSVRWDQDGDAMTRQAGDLVGVVPQPINPGTLDVPLIISGALRATTDLNAPPGEAPDSAPASAPANDPPPTAPPTGADITGTVQFAPDMIPDNPGAGTFFIIARRADAAVGPPLAVVRMDGAAGPAPFSIGPANIMAGGDFNAPVLLTVRWDQDSNAMSKQPGDLEGTASVNPVNPGTTGVVLLLDRKLP